MKIKIGINGFGRIGRAVFRILSTRPDEFEVKIINDVTDPAILTNLLKYDTTFGPFMGQVKLNATGMEVNGKNIFVTKEKDPENIPWASSGVDIVLESSGRFRTRTDMSKHLSAGAPKVLLSAPSRGDDSLDATIILGVNDEILSPNMLLVSTASCTSNCVIPMAKILHDNFTIVEGLMTTSHAYTSTQELLDSGNKDLRRGRAAAQNIIPTTTGAADLVGQIIPALNGKVTGMALRVPVSCGSITDFTALLKTHCTQKEINEVFREAAAKNYKGIVEYTEEPIVSSDIIGNNHSCIFDGTWTIVMKNNLVKVLGWYDNEWGYSSRVVDVLKLMVTGEK